MRRFIQRLLPMNPFARSVSVLAGGTLAGQLIVVAASPILTRLYTPEDFGLFAVFAALIGTFAVVASLRYHLAIPLPEKDSEARDLVALSSLVVVAVTLILSLAAVLLREYIALVFNAPLLAVYIWLVPIGVFFTGLYQIYNYLALRQNAVGSLARTKVSQASVMTAIHLGGYAIGPLALLLGRVLGQSAGILTLIRATRAPSDQPAAQVGLAQRLRSVGFRYRNFPLVSTWAGLASSGAGNLPPLLIASLFGPMSAGFFALTHRVLSQPMAILGKAVGDVFYREAAQAHSEDSLSAFVDSVYEKLVTLALPAATLIFIAAPPVFVIVFGKQWQQAGEIARWMVVWLLFQFIASPPTRVYPILNKHGAALRFQLALLASSCLSLFIGALLFNSFEAGVATMSILNSGVYFSRVMLTYDLLGMSPFRPLIVFIGAIPWSAFCNFPLGLVWFVSSDLDASEPIFIVFFSTNAFLVAVFLIVKMRTYVKLGSR